ncbi:unnamed protein product [Euphydryas editha]|uniref:Reverse transcriptase domain-containing protein n=1 Tax=Euphydryas editha TaxID=104508 RepID=A0AAU9UBB1_EUPED|nr:unnamed protein product [Euphydryas editha]
MMGNNTIHLCLSAEITEKFVQFKKLEGFEIRGLALEWFNSYLSAWYRCVQVGADVSKKLTVGFGVPQGSVLGAILFIVYISAISGKEDIICYADYTAIIFQDSTWEETYKAAKKEMSRVADWLLKNLLSLNKY